MFHCKRRKIEVTVKTNNQEASGSVRIPGTLLGMGQTCFQRFRHARRYLQRDEFPMNKSNSVGSFPPEVLGGGE